MPARRSLDNYDNMDTRVKVYTRIDIEVVLALINREFRT